MDKKKKIIGIVLIAIILIGIIIVCTKGFNVGLSLRPHDTLEYVFNEKYDLSKIEKICDEVFKNKTYRIRGVEIFNDAVYIESSTITEEEKTALLEKLDAIYKTEESEEENYIFYSDSNIRLRDEVKKYILPSLISLIVISVYVGIRFKNVREVIKIVIEMIGLLLIILSIVAICRIPVEKLLFQVLVFVELIYLVIKFACLENKLKEEK